MRLVEFEKSDYEIHDRPKLDKILLELCHHMIEGQRIDPDKYGMVAACVLDPENRRVYGVNEAAGDNKRRHAERVAVDRYIEHYGDIPAGSIIVTTLSPCNEDDTEMADGRYGESCTDLVNSLNCRKVYCGYIDPTQQNEHAKYTLEETSNSEVQRLCKKFADTFLKKLDEAVYPGNIGIMELTRFYKEATPEEKAMFQKLVAEKKSKSAWELLQKVLGIRLHPSAVS